MASEQQQIANCLKHGELVAAMQRMCPPEVYWLHEFLFPSTSVRMSDSGTFNLLEIIEQAVGPAQFASLCAIKGNVISTGESLNLTTITAPRIFEENHMGVCDTDSLVLNPATGQEFASWQEKLDYAQAKRAGIFVQRLRKRLELMSAELLKTGKMTIDGQNVETMVIDFARDTDNTVTIAAADKWCATTSKPLDMLGDITTEVFQCESEGIVDVIISQKAAKSLINHAQIVDLMKLQAQNQCTGCLLNMDMFPQRTRVIGQKLLGEFGSYRIWQFDGKLQMPNGTGFTSTRLLDENDAYLIMRDAFKGTRGYGAIKDMLGLHRETAYFNQSVNRHGIKQEFESRPLLIPSNINATAVLKGVIGC